MRPESPSATPVRLSAVSLFADSEERPVQWDTVFSADYGPDIAELGSIVAREQGAPNFPRSFAIDNDGSVWILDAVKHRIAHYSQQGVFAGSLDGGLRLDPHHLYPIDMAVIGRSVYVLLEETLRQWVVVLSRGDVEGRTSLVHDGVNPLIYEFVSSQPRLTGITLGSWDGTDVSGDPGVAWFDVPGSGRMHTLPGIPLVDGWVLCRADGGDLFLEYTGQDGRIATQDVRVRLVRYEGASPDRTVLSIADQVPVGDSIGLLLFVSSDLRSGNNYGGRWYLQLSSDGDVEVWERLADPMVDDSSQRRHISTDLSGDVYYMLVRRDRVDLLRRPTSDG